MIEVFSEEGGAAALSSCNFPPRKFHPGPALTPSEGDFLFNFTVFFSKFLVYF